MGLNNYRVVVMTSDKYIKALRPFAYLFNKYWSSDIQVVVAGFTPPDFDLPDNFVFLSLGKFEDFPINKWSDALIKVCDTLEDDVFVLMLEDYWLIRGVDLRGVSILADYARQFSYVLKIDLCADRLYAGGVSDYGHVGHLDLVKSHPESAYHMSLMTGLWRKDRLREVLVPSWTPWDVEISGTSHLRHLSVRQDGTERMIVIGTKQWPVKHTLAFRGGDVGRLLLDDIHKEDIDHMLESRMLYHWRPQEQGEQ